MPEASSSKTIPPLLSPAQVGKACGISRRAAKNMLRRAGVLEQVGARWYVGERACASAYRTSTTACSSTSCCALRRDHGARFDQSQYGRRGPM